jgi:hypothetical protein
MTLPAGLKDWRTTLIGTAQFINGLVPAWQLYQTAMAGLLSPQDVQRLAMYGATFLLVNGVLQQVKGAITPSSAKVKEKTAEQIAAALTNPDGGYPPIVRPLPSAPGPPKQR